MNLRNFIFLGLGLLIVVIMTVSFCFLRPSHKSSLSGQSIEVPAALPIRPALSTDPAPSPKSHVEKTQDGVYLYNDRGQLAAITYPNGSVYMYMYDAYGDKISEGSGPGKTWTYRYDTNHQLISVTDPQGHVTH